MPYLFEQHPVSKQTLCPFGLDSDTLLFRFQIESPYSETVH